MIERVKIDICAFLLIGRLPRAQTAVSARRPGLPLNSSPAVPGGLRGTAAPPDVYRPDGRLGVLLRKTFGGQFYQPRLQLRPNRTVRHHVIRMRNSPGLKLFSHTARTAGPAVLPHPELLNHAGLKEAFHRADRVPVAGGYYSYRILSYKGYLKLVRVLRHCLRIS